MAKVKFIKEKYLEESPYLTIKHFKTEAEAFLKKIKKPNKSCVFWLIGPFWSGKSTMLNDVKRLIGEDDIRINFDSWKFPERKELRDWFVLSITAEIIKDRYDEIKNKIDGKEKTTEFLDIIKDFSWPIWDIAKITNKILNDNTTLWVKRIDEYQRLLGMVLEKACMDRQFTPWSNTNNNIYVILEDVDRSGQEGIYFLETLNNFIKTIDTNTIHSKIICICPISEESIEENFQKYLKVFDYYDFFNPEINIEKFISYGFKRGSLTPEKKSILIEIIDTFLKKDPKHTMREIKFLFRICYNNYLNNNKDIDRFIYFLGQIYIRWKKFNSYESQGDIEKKIKKWIKKRKIIIWSHLDTSVWPDIDQICLRWIIRNFRIINSEIPGNITKINIIW